MREKEGESSPPHQKNKKNKQTIAIYSYLPSPPPNHLCIKIMRLLRRCLFECKFFTSFVTGGFSMKWQVTRIFFKYPNCFQQYWSLHGLLSSDHLSLQVFRDYSKGTNDRFCNFFCSLTRFKEFVDFFFSFFYFQKQQNPLDDKFFSFC